MAALGGVEFEWPVGLVALMGPNGAGKSTLLRLIIGDLKPAGGSLTVGARVVGYVPQHADWPGRFTVTDFLTYLCWLQGVPRRRWAQRIGQAVAAVDLGAVAEARLDSLSGGLHRRAMIAQALLSDPELLVLDEPSAGLDPRQRVQLRTLLSGLADSCTVVVATHLVEDVEEVAHHVTMLDGGQVVCDLPLSEIEQRWAVPGGGSPLEAAYLGLVSS